MSAVQKSKITVDTLTLSKQQSLHQTSGFLLLGEWGGGEYPPPPAKNLLFPPHLTPLPTVDSPTKFLFLPPPLNNNFQVITH